MKFNMINGAAMVVRLCIANQFLAFFLTDMYIPGDLTNYSIVLVIDLSKGYTQV